MNHINFGDSWKDNINYPIRKRKSGSLSIEIVDKIIDLLFSSNLSQKEIAEKFNIARTTVTAINQGKNNKRKDIEYPIRKERIKH